MNKRLLVAFCMLFILSSIVGCSGTDTKTTAPAAPVAVELAFLRGPTAVGAISMMTNYDGKKDGMQINYSMEQTPDVLAQRLVEGKITMATLPTNMAANLYNKSGKYQLVAMNTWGVMYVVTAGETIKSWSDLKGKEIDTSGKGAAPDIVLKYLLKQNGLDPDKDVSLKYASTPVEQAQLISAGKSKISVLPEPWATMVLKQNPSAQVALDFQKEWTRINGDKTPFAQTCLVVNAEFAKAHPDLVEKLLAEYAASIDWVNKNPAEAGKLIGARKDIGIDGAVATDAIPRCNIKYQSAADAKEAVNKYLDILFKFNPESIGGKMPDDGFFYKK